jgi:hypothetical protein
MSTQKIVVRPYEPFEDIGGSTSLAEGKAHADLFFQKFPEMRFFLFFLFTFYTF